MLAEVDVGVTCKTWRSVMLSTGDAIGAGEVVCTILAFFVGEGSPCGVDTDPLLPLFDDGEIASSSPKIPRVVCEIVVFKRAGAIEAEDTKRGSISECIHQRGYHGKSRWEGGSVVILIRKGPVVPEDAAKGLIAVGTVCATAAADARNGLTGEVEAVGATAAESPEGGIVAVMKGRATAKADPEVETLFVEPTIGRTVVAAGPGEET